MRERRVDGVPRPWGIEGLTWTGGEAAGLVDSDFAHRPRRIAVFADAYGLGSRGGLVDAVIARQEATIGVVRLLAAQGVEPQATWVREGHVEELASRVSWPWRHVVRRVLHSADGRDHLLPRRRGRPPCPRRADR